MRAAGIPCILTVAEPLTMVSGGPMQNNRSPTLAAGSPPISTVGRQGPIMGPPTCGICIGPTGVFCGHWCISMSLAAGGMVHVFVLLIYFYERAFHGYNARRGELGGCVSFCRKPG